MNLSLMLNKFLMKFNGFIRNKFKDERFEFCYIVVNDK